MKPLVLALAGVLVLLCAVPFGAAVLVTVLAAPAVAEQLRQGPCSYLTADATGSTASAGTPAAAASTATGTGAVLPPIGSPRRASLRNPPLPIPARIRTLYLQAAARYGVSWALLAGVGMEETAHGRNTATSTAGARGLMQFMPATWRAYRVDGDHDGQASITNDADSIHTAARYLAATGARTSVGMRAALYAYNHALWYVNDVLHYAHHYAGDTTTPADTGSSEEIVCDPSGDPGGDPGPVPDGPHGPCPPTSSPAEHGLKPNALRGLRCVKQAFGWIRSMGGVGPRPNKSDHPAGRAVDFMIPNWNTKTGNARGWQVARWLQHHAAALRVKYIIFDDHVWRAYRASAGWTRYTHPNGATRNPTLRHLDHVHLSTG